MKTPKPPNDGMAMSYNEIGAVLGLTGERVRQIEATALAKLRIALHLEGLTLYDFINEIGNLDDS